jgi:hypothetical protein
MAMNSVGLGTKNRCADDSQQAVAVSQRVPRETEIGLSKPAALPSRVQGLKSRTAGF